MFNYHKDDLQRVLFSFIFDNDENVALLKNITLFMTKMAKIS